MTLKKSEMSLLSLLKNNKKIGIKTSWFMLLIWWKNIKIRCQTESKVMRNFPKFIHKWTDIDSLQLITLEKK